MLVFFAEVTRLKKVFLQLKKGWSWIALTLIILTIFAVRLSALNKYPTPPSEDLGGHLTVLDALHRSDAVRPERKFHHPPLYYLVLDLLTRIFPVFVALKIVTALISTIIAIPFFILARKVARNDGAAIIATALFTFSEGYSEIIGWGGIPNLFGIFFMVFSMYYLIRAVEGDSWKKGLIAGFLLSITVGTHPLTSAYYVIAILLSFLVLILVRAMSVKRALRVFVPLGMVGILSSLPYLQVYTFLFTNRVNVATVSQLDWSLYPSYLEHSLLNIAREWYTVIIVVIISIASFINLWRHHSSKKISVIILSFAIAILILAFLLNPSVMGRVFYFLYVPIFLAFGILLSDYFKLTTSLKLSKKLVFSSLLTVVILTSVATAYSRMVVAIDYYHILNDEVVEALEWLKQNTNNDDVTITNYDGLGGWIEGYALRKAYSSKPLGLIVTSTEYRETITANKILAGNHVIENNHLLISDFFPVGYNNPGIFLKTQGNYEELIFLNDEYQSIYFSPLGNSLNELLITNFLSVENKTAQSMTTSEGVVCTYSYRWYFGTANRTIEVSAAPYVNVTYAMSLPNYSVRNSQMMVNIFSVTKVKSYIVTDNILKLDLLNPSGQVTSLTITVVETSGKIADVTFMPLEPISMLQALVFTINTTGSYLYTKLQISLESVSPTEGFVEYTNAYELLKANDIKYVILDKNRYGEFHRFTYESQRYKPVFENGRVLILEVDS